MIDVLHIISLYYNVMNCQNNYAIIDTDKLRCKKGKNEDKGDYDLGRVLSGGGYRCAG